MGSPLGPIVGMTGGGGIGLCPGNCGWPGVGVYPGGGATLIGPAGGMYPAWPGLGTWAGQLGTHSWMNKGGGTRARPVDPDGPG